MSYRLYNHIMKSNYANLKTKINDFRKVNIKKKEARKQD